MKTAIVLSGGGAKGSYQLGVWKALRKLKIKYDIVTGTSVGALNGVMMVQGDYKSALDFWYNINYKLIFDKDFKKVKENIYLTYIKGFITEGGMDITNLENALDQVFDENKFYSSNIDFGIVVYNFTEKKEELITKNNVPSTDIKDYIIASATLFPAFKMKKINKEKYIDGGIYDNLPINLAIDMGADKIIVVDLKAPGIKQKAKQPEKIITTISPRNNIGTMLEFDKNIARRNIRYGYNDTMKTFDKLIGNKYTFNKYIYNFSINKMKNEFDDALNKYLSTEKDFWSEIQKLISMYILKDFHLKEHKFIDIIEQAGKTLKRDDSRIYFLDYYNHLLRKEFKKISEVNRKLIKDKINKKDINSLLGSKYIVKYIYQIIKNEKDYKELYNLVPLFKKEFLTAIYLISIGC